MVLPSPLRRKFFSGADFDIYRRMMRESRDAARKIRNFRLFFLLVCVPALLIQGRIAYKKHKAELAKPRPEYIPYAYLNKRYSKWPWGDGNHSLFHNPEKNWVPGVGYEKDPPAQTDNN